MKTNSQLQCSSWDHLKSTHKLFIGVTSFFFVTHVVAAEVTSDIKVSAETRYDSNPNLSVNRIPTWIYSVTPEYLLDINDEVNHGYVDAAFLFERHSNNQVLINRNDPRLTAGWDRTYETGYYGIKADYIESSSLLSELTSTGQFNNTDNTQKIKQVGAHWKQEINPRWSVLSEAAYHDISFTKNNPKGYTLGEIKSKLAYLNNENLDTYAQVGYSHFNTDNIFDSTNLVSLVAGVNYKITEGLKVGGYGGVANLSGGQSRTDGIGGVTVEYKVERSTYNLELNRDLEPSIAGGFQMRDSFSLGYLFNVTESDTIGANYRFFRYRGDTDINLVGITYQEAMVEYDRKLSNHWKATVSAVHKELDNNSLNKLGNVVGVNLVYETLKF